MEGSGYQVHRFSDPRHNDATVDFLQRLHYQVQAQFRNKHHQQQQQQQQYYKRGSPRWHQVASARKVLAKNALGEKKLAIVFNEFLNAQSFRQPYNEEGKASWLSALPVSKLVLQIGMSCLGAMPKHCVHIWYP
jgi:hypothetical protein